MKTTIDNLKKQTKIWTAVIFNKKCLEKELQFATQNNIYMPTSSIYREIIQESFNTNGLNKIIDRLTYILDFYCHQRLRILKAFIIIEKLLLEGSDQFIRDCEIILLSKIKSYTNFVFIEHNQDKAQTIRDKVEYLIELLSDKNTLYEKRTKQYDYLFKVIGYGSSQVKVPVQKQIKSQNQQNQLRQICQNDLKEKLTNINENFNFSSLQNYNQVYSSTQNKTISAGTIQSKKNSLQIYQIDSLKNEFNINMNENITNKAQIDTVVHKNQIDNCENLLDQFEPQQFKEVIVNLQDIDFSVQSNQDIYQFKDGQKQNQDEINVQIPSFEDELFKKKIQLQQTQYFNYTNSEIDLIDLTNLTLETRNKK